MAGVFRKCFERGWNFSASTAESLYLRHVTPMAIQPVNARVMATDNKGQIALWFSILSICCFMFLLTFWIAISSVPSSQSLCVSVAVGSMIALTFGAISGLLGILFGREPNHRSSLIMGIVGLSLNGLFLIGMIVLIVLATVVTVIRLHAHNTTAQAMPVPGPSQQYYSQSNVDLVQNNLVSVQPTAPARVYYRTTVIRPIYPQVVQAPYFAPQPLRPMIIPQPMRPIFVPRPVMAITPMMIRHY
jgi:hypothetical protein